jgi:hypothetical protein
MSHDKGRCATDLETIYVQATATCASTVGAANGTATVPYCSMDLAVATLGAMPSKNLVVVRGDVANPSPFAISSRPISIVGQMNAGLGGTLRLMAGDLYVRQATVTAGALLVGCQADNGSTLRLDRVIVTGNKGGIYLDRAAFDIQNTIIANNGTRSTGAVTWGGVLVIDPPAAGPAKLQFVTVQDNVGGGIACSAALTMASGVRTSGNGSPDINDNCNLAACGAASATCGAQP